jgi:ankyrin repeat protein
MTQSLPTRRLSDHPDLDQIKRQAKELLAAFRAGEPAADTEVRTHFRNPDPHTFALHDAQLALARAYGFDSWPKLKARIDGVTVDRLANSIRSGDLNATRSMLATRPELAVMSSAHLTFLHQAVLARHPEMVRLLIKHGADPRAGLYPHRATTSAIAVATERGYTEVLQALAGSESAPRHSPIAPPLPGPLTKAVLEKNTDEVRHLLDLRHDPDERIRIHNSDEIEFSWGAPLWHAAGTGQYEIARLLLTAGADPNARVYASGSPMFQAISQGDREMFSLLTGFGGLPEATSAGLFRLTDLARQMLSGEAPCKLDGVGGDTVAEQLLWGAACGGDPEIVRLALTHVEWPRDDPRWFPILEQPLRLWSYGSVSNSWDRATYPLCFSLLLGRSDPNVVGRFGITILHSVADTRPHVTPRERVIFATHLLRAGARLDTRDSLFEQTPVEWAQRLNREELIELYWGDVLYPPLDRV